MMINLKKLSAALRDKQTVRWIVKDGHNIILTEHYVLKTNQEIKGAALTALIKILGSITKEGQGLENRYGERNILDRDKMKCTIDLIENHRKSKSIDYTKLIHQFDKKLLSIFKGDDYIYANKVYMDLIDLDEEDIEFGGSDRLSPIYAIKDDEKMLVVPYRVKEGAKYLIS